MGDTTGRTELQRLKEEVARHDRLIADARRRVEAARQKRVGSASAVACAANKGVPPPPRRRTAASC